MSIWEVLVIGVGLSMDAFAVAVGKGIAMPKFRARAACLIALCFGGFQALMPLLGWLLGKRFEGAITSVDHWIAFGLLLLIGGKMLMGALRPAKEADASVETGVLSLKELLLLSVATSIDALAVGVTFAFLSVSIGPAVLTIGVTTFVLSFGGVALGRTLGRALCQKAEIAGGVVLIGIGLKILIEHLIG